MKKYLWVLGGLTTGASLALAQNPTWTTPARLAPPIQPPNVIQSYGLMPIQATTAPVPIPNPPGGSSVPVVPSQPTVPTTPSIPMGNGPNNVPMMMVPAPNPPSGNLGYPAPAFPAPTYSPAPSATIGTPMPAESPVYPSYPTPASPAPSSSFLSPSPMTGIGPYSGSSGFYGGGPFSYLDGPVGPALWFGGDYLMYWSKGGRKSVPLVVTGSETDAFPGALDQPGTRVIAGNQTADFGTRSGFRARGGLWLTGNRRFGIEASGFMLEQAAASTVYYGGIAGQSYLARPFIDARTGAENVFFVSQNFANPDIGASVTGSIAVVNRSSLYSWDAHGVFGLFNTPASSMLFTLGFRQIGLRESLSIEEQTRPISGTAGVVYFNGRSYFDDSRLEVTDRFRTTNTFNGPQLGTRIEYLAGPFSIEVSAKVGIGWTTTVANIEGSSAIFENGRQTGSYGGGVLATTSNIGRYKWTEFAVVPEVGVNLGVQVTPWLRASVGYNYLYWSRVVRPADIVDRTVNPNQVSSDPDFRLPGGPSRPAMIGPKYSDYWLNGVNFGLEFRF